MELMLCSTLLSSLLCFRFSSLWTSFVLFCFVFPLVLNSFPRLEL